MGPPPSCPIKLWYIHSAVANTYKEEIESFFPLLRPQSLSCDIRLTACDGKKRNIFVSLSFWSMTEVVINIWQGPLYHFFIKVVDFWSLLEIEFPEATYASTWMYYILHTASKRKHYHLPALRARNSLWERASAAEKYIKYRTKKSFMLCVQ